MKVLSVGGGMDRSVPRGYRDWTVEILDIDPAVSPDVLCDAKAMGTLRGATHDAIYCSHMLEHCFRHDVPAVLAGFRHVLKPDGFAQLEVPDVGALIRLVAGNGMDLDATWYHTAAGAPISYHDVLFGWGAMVERGNLYFCHKTAFTEASLARALRRAEFPHVFTASDGANLHAFAFKRKPTAARRSALGI